METITPELKIDLNIPINLAIVGCVLQYFGNEHGVKAANTFYVVAAISLFAVAGYGYYRYNQDKKQIQKIIES